MLALHEILVRVNLRAHVGVSRLLGGAGVQRGRAGDLWRDVAAGSDDIVQRWHAAGCWGVARRLSVGGQCARKVRLWRYLSVGG